MLAYTIGWLEILIVAVVALLLFGRRLPEVSRGLGRSIVEFKKGLKDVKDDIEAEIDAEAGDKKPS